MGLDTPVVYTVNDGY